MRGYEITQRIDAPPAAIWAVLTDAARLRDGPTGLRALEGEIAPGARLMLESEAQPGRRFALRVTEMDAPRRMVWRGGMPLGLFTGTRSFVLVPDGDGTRLTLSERFTGPMAPLIFRSIPDLTPSMQRFALGVAEMAR